MGQADHNQALDQALNRIEETIFPNVGQMLSALLDAAASARTQNGREIEQMRLLAGQLDRLTREIETLSPIFRDPSTYRPGARPDSLTISA